MRLCSHNSSAHVVCRLWATFLCVEFALKRPSCCFCLTLRPNGVNLPPAFLACLLLVTAGAVRAWWCGPSGRAVTQQQLWTGENDLNSSKGHLGRAALVTGAACCWGQWVLRQGWVQSCGPTPEPKSILAAVLQGSGARQESCL